ncbi:hypothetical protein HDU97_006297 [Phlyctochytrium planicorne]|nr:hypothetical protein HDU97_006297 [Phlyctochytrium planicorne]
MQSPLPNLEIAPILLPERHYYDDWGYGSDDDDYGSENDSGSVEFGLDNDDDNLQTPPLYSLTPPPAATPAPILYHPISKPSPLNPLSLFTNFLTPPSSPTPRFSEKLARTPPPQHLQHHQHQRQYQHHHQLHSHSHSPSPFHPRLPQRGVTPPPSMSTSWGRPVSPFHQRVLTPPPRPSPPAPPPVSVWGKMASGSVDDEDEELSAAEPAAASAAEAELADSKEMMVVRISAPSPISIPKRTSSRNCKLRVSTSRTIYQEPDASSIPNFAEACRDSPLAEENEVMRVLKRKQRENGLPPLAPLVTRPVNNSSLPPLPPTFSAQSQHMVASSPQSAPASLWFLPFSTTSTPPPSQLASPSPISPVATSVFAAFFGGGSSTSSTPAPSASTEGTPRLSIVPPSPSTSTDTVAQPVSSWSIPWLSSAVVPAASASADDSSHADPASAASGSAPTSANAGSGILDPIVATGETALAAWTWMGEAVSGGSRRGSIGSIISTIDEEVREEGEDGDVVASPCGSLVGGGIAMVGGVVVTPRGGRHFRSYHDI